MPWINCFGGDSGGGKNARAKQQLISVSQPINLLIKVSTFRNIFYFIYKVKLKLTEISAHVGQHLLYFWGKTC